MYKQSLVVFLFLVVGFTNCLKAQSVFDNNSVTFYGIDFSHFKLADPKYLDQPYLVKEWMPQWVEKSTREKEYYESSFKKEFHFDFEYTLGLIPGLDKDNLVVDSKHVLPRDSVQAIVQCYDLKQEEGLGFVIIAECFNKHTKHPSAYFVWFDIDTREILNANYMSSKEADGYGMVNYWAVGLKGLLNQYRSWFKKNRDNF
ncbi:hypothetical protein [Fulvivirga ligni]|uniref:hypothetical protein n=1 Tax=Fulvivirga ligni TaxID=2904246 RepID=UPI001F358D24|nr:hypothetical protein [Fulvivirga ligni]UII20138.1 hypothetical protein LVD16_20030 [Fulvivirga ligni]